MALLLALFVSQLLLPLVLALWQWRGRVDSRLEWLLKTLMGASYLATITIAGIWLMPPWYAPYLYLGLFLLATVWSMRRARSAPWLPRPRAPLRSGVYAALAVLLLVVFLYAVSGRLPPAAQPVALAFPLRSGTYHVVNGGNNILLNFHLETLAKESVHRYRGQSYGVDIVKVDHLGLRASGILPSELSRYAIFGDPVYAPCGGVVIRAKNMLTDLVPPEADKKNLAGNFVLIECKHVMVLLAHLKQGSVQVAAREVVAEGQLIAEVGNSGNTGEPHLHLHAERGGGDTTFPSGDPVPMILDGRYLVRNDRVPRTGRAKRSYMSGCVSGLDPRRRPHSAPRRIADHGGGSRSFALTREATGIGAHRFDIAQSAFRAHREDGGRPSRRASRG